MKAVGSKHPLSTASINENLHSTYIYVYMESNTMFVVKATV